MSATTLLAGAPAPLLQVRYTDGCLKLGKDENISTWCVGNEALIGWHLVDANRNRLDPSRTRPFRSTPKWDYNEIFLPDGNVTWKPWLFSECVQYGQDRAFPFAYTHKGQCACE